MIANKESRFRLFLCAEPLSGRQTRDANELFASVFLPPLERERETHHDEESREMEFQLLCQVSFFFPPYMLA